MTMATKMQKHVRKDAVVESVEVTDDNIEKLAEQHGGTVHTSVRVEGLRFATFEQGGTKRINVGDVLVVRQHDGVVEALAPEEFAEQYEKA